MRYVAHSAIMVVVFLVACVMLPPEAVVPIIMVMAVLVAWALDQRED